MSVPASPGMSRSLISQSYYDVRCVGRNFCNSAMMITKERDNRLTFTTDRRGFLVSFLGFLQ